MSRMDSLGSNQPTISTRRQPPRWLWVGIIFAAGMVLLGVLATNNTTGEQLQWGWEKARAWGRDTFVRQSETLPTVLEEAPIVPAVVKQVELDVDVFASYESSADIAPAVVAPPAVEVDAPLTDEVIVPEPVEYELLTPPTTFELTGFKHEFQGINNCGPATLAMNLSYWGWQGDQNTIAEVLKPVTRDKNVRWDELVYYVRTQAGWLDALFRVGGDFNILQLFVANGYPVIIETGYTFDNYWVGHYLLVTGYDAENETFIVQDVTGGPNRVMTYMQVDELWQQFNRLFILVFPADERDKIEFMLADHAKLDINRSQALKQAEAEVIADPENAFAWFNLGSNLNYFDRYEEAATAFDTAREFGLPWRMLFYQFGPYIAYFNAGRYQDVDELATVTLQARPDLEESYVWRGWARHMLGDTPAGIADFNAALEVNPNFNDAISALKYFGAR